MSYILVKLVFFLKKNINMLLVPKKKEKSLAYNLEDLTSVRSPQKLTFLWFLT